MFFKNKTILIATKHQKEKVIAPAIEKAMSCKTFTPRDFDTDQFGTFCGQTKRTSTAYKTVIQKAKTAAEQYGYRYAIANEGSFGAHPEYLFVPGDIEFITLVDVERNIDITEWLVSTETNYQQKEIAPEDNYQDFLNQVKFPSHGLLIKGLGSGEVLLNKGIQDSERLEATLKKGFADFKTLRLETDMRAMMNPTRIRVIGELTEKLIGRLLRTCPLCQYPGFGKRSTQGQLPCEACDLPTTLYRQVIESCVACEHSVIYPREDGLKKAPMGQCPYCNP